jgi:hypothetical protein
MTYSHYLDYLDSCAQKQNKRSSSGDGMASDDVLVFSERSAPSPLSVVFHSSVELHTSVGAVVWTSEDSAAHTASPLVAPPWRRAFRGAVHATRLGLEACLLEAARDVRDASEISTSRGFGGREGGGVGGFKARRRRQAEWRVNGWDEALKDLQSTVLF